MYNRAFAELDFVTFLHLLLSSSVGFLMQAWNTAL